MNPSSAAAPQWDFEATAPADNPLQLSMHDANSVAPAPAPDPAERANSTRATLIRGGSNPTLLNLSPRISGQHATAKPLAEWQGYVTKVEGDHLIARMEGVFGEGVEGRTHDAVIPLSEVSPEDRALVRAGAYFRLSVAYAMSRSVGGTFRRTSTLVFRRLPAYHAVDLERAREMARELLGGIRLE